MKPSAIIAAMLIAGGSVATAAIPQTPAETEKMNAFVDGLLKKMTLEEKLGQLNLPAGGDLSTGDPLGKDIVQLAASGQIGGTFNIKGAEKFHSLQKAAVEKTRLGIPLLFGMDVIHGYETIFPIPLGLSCSWDLDAIEQSAQIAAREATAGGVNWTFSPMVDIARDPRWGRVAEGSGEDPYLGSQIARAMVRGYQGDLTRDDQMAACVKHFALYGASEAGRDYNTVDMSRQRMYNEYLAPYKAAVDEGALSVMTSFNLVDGIPATANKWLITDLLRDQWGFDGMVVTDYGSINEMRSHGVAELPEASAMALNAGTDMDMCSDGFLKTLKESLANGAVTQTRIDDAVRKILEIKYKLGLFDNPYKYGDTKREAKEIYSDANRAEARKIAAETFVLLKNDNNLLPLKRQGKIALIGPLADNGANLIGTWAMVARKDRVKTLRQAMKDAVGNKAEILYAKGTNTYSDPDREATGSIYNNAMRDPRSEQEMLDEALKVAAQADVIVAALGEMGEDSGESSSRSDLNLPENQRKLLEALLATGKPVVMLNFTGRPTLLTWEKDNVPAIMNVWFGGSEAGDAISDVIFGDVSPSGKLTMSIPYSVGQIPVYYNHMNTGRPKDENNPKFQQYTSNYMDLPSNEALYPFGYGLSYTTFDYTDFKLDNSTLTPGGAINASVKVTNTGNRPADEIVQFYTHDLFGSIARPVKELKHFERISLKPGESRTVNFRITPDNLKFYNSNLEYVAEPGKFEVMVGPNSRDLQRLPFTLAK